MTNSVKVITVVYNTAFYVYKFRMRLISELQSQGYRVVVVSPVDDYVPILEENGIEHCAIAMSQYGMNPLREVLTIFELYKVFRKYKPVASLHYTIKPNIFGSIAASFLKIPVICNIAGAGRAFSNDTSLFSKAVSLLYRIGLRNVSKVFFQNNDDYSLFVGRGLVDKTVAERIPGSGVDLRKYIASANEPEDGVFRFLFLGRLLREKGIEEYLDAAKAVLKERHEMEIHFLIVGELESLSSYVSKEKMDSSLHNPSIKYLGTVSPDAVPGILRSVDCMVLPSFYREGVPRSLLEAAATGKPIITTDNIGCRDVVEDGVNGYMVPVRDVESLAQAMQKMLGLSGIDRLRMGQAGRKKMELEFDEAIVLKKYRKAVFDIDKQGLTN
jgi:glycosyltransferase involved in cell wall biosynthesis